MPARTFHLLLVEDNLAHARLATLAIQRAPVPATVDHVADGEQAMAYLERRQPFESHSNVDLVLLDLKAPNVDGIEVLRWLKSNPALQTIPVVALSASLSPAEAEVAYRSHANSFLTKPLDYDDFQQMIDDLLQYWATWNEPV